MKLSQSQTIPTTHLPLDFSRAVPQTSSGLKPSWSRVMSTSIAPAPVRLLVDIHSADSRCQAAEPKQVARIICFSLLSLAWSPRTLCVTVSPRTQPRSSEKHLAQSDLRVD